MDRKRIAAFLSPFIPGDAVEHTTDLFCNDPVQLRITRSRKTKYGDYRPPYNGKGHRISVNGDLNRYAFLITLIHELAHYHVQVKFGNTVKPHGIEWKQTFRKLMVPLLNNRVFPDELLQKMRIYMSNPKASTCSDPLLLRTLNQYNPNPETYLDDLKPGDLFIMNNRVFQKKEKRRTRHLCIELPQKRQVLINGIAPVQPVENPKLAKKETK